MAEAGRVLNHGLSPQCVNLFSISPSGFGSLCLGPASPSGLEVVDRSGILLNRCLLDLGQGSRSSGNLTLQQQSQGWTMEGAHGSQVRQCGM